MQRLPELYKYVRSGKVYYIFDSGYKAMSCFYEDNIYHILYPQKNELFGSTKTPILLKNGETVGYTYSRFPTIDGGMVWFESAKHFRGVNYIYTFYYSFYEPFAGFVDLDSGILYDVSDMTSGDALQLLWSNKYRCPVYISTAAGAPIFYFKKGDVLEVYFGMFDTPFCIPSVSLATTTSELYSDFHTVFGVDIWGGTPLGFIIDLDELRVSLFELKYGSYYLYPVTSRVIDDDVVMLFDSFTGSPPESGDFCVGIYGKWKDLFEVENASDIISNFDIRRFKSVSGVPNPELNKVEYFVKEYKETYDGTPAYGYLHEFFIALYRNIDWQIGGMFSDNVSFISYNGFCDPRRKISEDLDIYDFDPSKFELSSRFATVELVPFYYYPEISITDMSSYNMEEVEVLDYRSEDYCRVY